MSKGQLSWIGEGKQRVPASAVRSGGVDERPLARRMDEGGSASPVDR